MKIKILFFYFFINVFCSSCFLGEGTHANATYLLNDSSYEIEIKYYLDGSTPEKNRIYLKQKERYLVGESSGRGNIRGGISFLQIARDSVVVSTNGKNYTLAQGSFSLQSGLPYTDKNNFFNLKNYIYKEVSSKKKFQQGEYIFYFRDFD